MAFDAALGERQGFVVLAAALQDSHQQQIRRRVPRQHSAEGLFGLCGLAGVPGLQEVLGQLHLQRRGIFSRLKGLVIGIGRLGVVLVGPLGTAQREIGHGILGLALNATLRDRQGLVRFSLADGLADALKREPRRCRHLLVAEGPVAVGFGRPLLLIQERDQGFVDRLPLSLGGRFSGIDDRQGLLVTGDRGVAAAGGPVDFCGGQAGHRLARLQQRRLLEGH